MEKNREGIEGAVDQPGGGTGLVEVCRRVGQGGIVTGQRKDIEHPAIKDV